MLVYERDVVFTVLSPYKKKPEKINLKSKSPKYLFI
jgi:hypothetical protein